jgi:hypothetical protein
MSNILIKSIFIVLIVLSSCGCISDDSDNENINNNNYIEIIGNGTLSNEEYNVYSAVLSPMGYFDSDPELYVIDELTDNYWTQDDNLINYFEDEAEVELDDEMIEDFQQKNEMRYYLTNNFSLSQDVVLISDQEVHEIFDEGWWDDFYEIYPNSTGIIEISRVGFNNDRNKAFLYFGYQAGGLAGAGYFILLSKNIDNWIMDEIVMLWIS